MCSLVNVSKKYETITIVRTDLCGPLSYNNDICTHVHVDDNTRNRQFFIRILIRFFKEKLSKASLTCLLVNIYIYIYIIY